MRNHLIDMYTFLPKNKFGPNTNLTKNDLHLLYKHVLLLDDAYVLDKWQIKNLEYTDKSAIRKESLISAIKKFKTKLDLGNGADEPD